MADLVNIGLTNTTHETASSLLRFFDSLIDVARFAFAYAIRENLIYDYDNEYLEAKRSVWNVGSLDSDGFMSILVQTFYGNTDEPYKTIERLINLGLLRIGKSIDSEGLTSISKWL
jgi:hypothetical protein